MGEQLRVLLVEDHPPDVEIVRGALNAWREQPHVLTTVARLAEAFPFLAADRIDVVLLDLTLPDSAGVPTVERVRAMARDVPIVAFTGHDGKQLGLGCIEAGAADYLDKTELTPHALRRSLAFALERRRRSEVDKLEEALARYREVIDALGGGKGGRHTPEAMRVVAEHYRRVLDGYVVHVLDHGPRPVDAARGIATMFGELGAGPDELIACHVQTVVDLVKKSDAPAAPACAAADLQLALDATRGLLEFYRTRGRKPRPELEDP